MKLRKWIILAAMLGMLSAIMWIGFDVLSTISDSQTPENEYNEYIVVGIGAVLALTIACGMTALLYHSRMRQDEGLRANHRPHRE
jgi:hypothetical protein